MDNILWGASATGREGLYPLGRKYANRIRKYRKCKYKYIHLLLGGRGYIHWRVKPVTRYVHYH